MSDRWQVGSNYEQYIGRWSRAVAREFLHWIALPGGAHVLDLGCGTGALASLALERAGAARVTGCDRSHGYVSAARAALRGAAAEFTVADARDLPLRDHAFDAAISGLVLNFVPKPLTAMRELRRVVAPGGSVAIYLWDYAGRMALIRKFWDAAIALDPAAGSLDEARRFPLCAAEPLEALFREAGLSRVESRAIDVATIFRDFDDFWSPFLSGEGPAPGYAMGLSAEQRAALRERLRATLHARKDGSIVMTARAWAVKGTTPR